MTVIPPRMSEVQRDALDPVDGTVVDVGPEVGGVVEHDYWEFRGGMWWACGVAHWKEVTYPKWKGWVQSNSENELYAVWPSPVGPNAVTVLEYIREQWNARRSDPQAAHDDDLITSDR